MDIYIGLIIPAAFSFTPRGFLPCDGRLIPVSQNQALFAVIGKVYGGDGVNNFGLPDLRGRFPLGYNPVTLPGRITANMGIDGGSATSSNNLVLAGAATATIGIANLPEHTHTATFTPVTTPVVPPTVTINASKDPATSSAALAGGYIGTAAMTGANQPHIYAAAAGTGTTALNSAMATVGAGSGGMTGGSVAVQPTGTSGSTSVPVNISALTIAPPPFQGIQYFICVEGLFPTRN